MKKKYEILFTPMKIGTCEIKNRFVLCPMEPTSLIEWTTKPGGYKKQNHDLIIDRAKDGVGLIIPGAICLYSFQGKQWLYKHPEAFEGIQELMDEVHSYGSKVFFQLSAGMGRNIGLTKELYAQKDFLKAKNIMDIDYINASADDGNPNRWMNELKTRALTKEEIHDLVNAFAETAYLCKQNGVDGIDVHAVHEGYLMDQFTLPYTNHRTDEYGGSLENRLRFACEVVKAIKAKCGEDYPVILRYSVTSKTRDFNQGIIPADTESVEIGRDMEESKKAIQILSEAGYDAFNADNGTYDAWYYPHPPVYMPLNCNLKESIEIKKYTDKPIINAGKLQLDAAAEAIENGQLDFAGIARQLLVDGQFLTKVREEREEDIIPCIACHLGCMPHGLWKNSGGVMGSIAPCALNPYSGNEKKYAVVPSKNPKSIAVIGAGIAGMEFALQAVRRGHKVTIYEKSDRVGGVFNEAASFTFKEKDRDLIKYYETQMAKAKITIKFHSEIESLSELDEDEIVVATGHTSARSLSVPGAERAVNALEFLKNGMTCEDQVVIVGGGLTGCEIAYELAMQGKHPIIVEVMDDILEVPGVSMANTSYLRDAFDYYKVPIYVSAKVCEITDHSVKLETEDGSVQEIPCDTVVTSIGYLPGSPFADDSDHVHVIGDAEKVSNLRGAIFGANDLVLELDREDRTC